MLPSPGHESGLFSWHASSPARPVAFQLRISMSATLTQNCMGVLSLTETPALFNIGTACTQIGICSWLTGLCVHAFAWKQSATCRFIASNRHAGGRPCCHLQARRFSKQPLAGGSLSQTAPSLPWASALGTCRWPLQSLVSRAQFRSPSIPGTLSIHLDSPQQAAKSATCTLVSVV